jgi:DNA-binding NarL/FixJ family response regulator
MVAPALLAQADGVLSKQASARVLCDTLQRAVTESGDPPQLSPAARRALHDILETEEMALVGLLLLGTPPGDIARALRMEPRALGARVEALLCRVGAALGLPQRAPTPASRP